ncbi:MAG TPA: hypothetical protein PKD99_12425 [Sphingopyxis sp.]|nr:hypothetical protein [Sphingopyxis sp.]HMP45904.1 hypothetical protein [Sphingopyxis sp.]
MSDINWRGMIEGFDANEALTENRVLWLKLGVMFRDVAANFSDFLESPSSADEAMAWAARAEACFWRATGDADAIDADRFLDPLATPNTPDMEKEKP